MQRIQVTFWQVHSIIKISKWVSYNYLNKDYGNSLSGISDEMVLSTGVNMTMIIKTYFRSSIIYLECNDLFKAIFPIHKLCIFDYDNSGSLNYIVEMDIICNIVVWYPVQLCLKCKIVQHTAEKIPYSKFPYQDKLITWAWFVMISGTEFCSNITKLNLLLEHGMWWLLISYQQQSSSQVS